VHGRYLVLNHRGVRTETYVFDADALANGRQDGTVMTMAPLATFPYNSFLVMSSSSSTYPPTDWIVPVNTHHSPHGLTYFVSGNGNLLLVFAVMDPAANGGSTGAPPLLMNGVAVPLGYPYHFPSCNPAYRNGKLYVAAHRLDATGRYFTRVIRLPVGLNQSGSALWHSTNPADGFLDYAIGNHPTDVLNYLFPSVEVTKNNDMVVGYQRVGTTAASPLAHGVRYNVYYDGGTGPSPSSAIRNGDALSPNQPPPLGTIDLPGTALDPSDDLTVWIANAYADSAGTLHPVIGGVKP
jgi:hypothetical protein